MTPKVLLPFALIALAASASAEVRERPYDFRARLAQVHTPNLRDWSAPGRPREFGFTNGMRVGIGPNAEPLVERAATDLCDYFAVSMGVSVSVDRSGTTNALAVTVRLDPSLAARASRITVGPRGVTVLAADARAAQQALFHLEDVMSLRRAPSLPFGTESRRARFTPRMTHSGWGLDQFPDAHLDQIAHYGLDAILVYISDVDRTSGVTKADVADLIRRAKLRGLDTYLYSYVVAFAHPDDPGADELYEKTYGRIAAAYPDAKGIVFVGESCQFPSRDERAIPLHTRQREEVAAYRAKKDFRPLAGWFPCRDYADWVSAVKRTIRRHAPGMEIVFWTYNWGCQPLAPRIALLETLPKDIALEVTFEMFEQFEKRNGLKSRVSDYSMVFPGPGKYFASEAVAAKRLGLKLYAMANSAGLTWDFSTIPYNPFPQQWKKRFDAVVKAQDDWGLIGLMESHHYGWFPNFVAELAKEAYTEGGMPFDVHLRAIAARDFGEANADRAVAIWREWSDRIADMHSTNENQYGPFRYGPAYPFNALEPDLKDSEFPLPAYHLIANYRRLAHSDDELRLQVELFEPMAEAYLKGGAAFARMAAGADDVRDIPLRLAADESAHTVKDALERIERGYRAMALKPIAKTMSMSMKIAQAAFERNVPCFCADLTVCPALVEWNKSVAARLPAFPGIGDLGLVETNGHMNFRNWETMRNDLAYPGAHWTRTEKGVFECDADYYAKSGGILEPMPRYEKMYEG